MGRRGETHTIDGTHGRTPVRWSPENGGRRIGRACVRAFPPRGEGEREAVAVLLLTARRRRSHRRRPTRRTHQGVVLSAGSIAGTRDRPDRLLVPTKIRHILHNEADIANTHMMYPRIFIKHNIACSFSIYFQNLFFYMSL